MQFGHWKDQQEEPDCRCHRARAEVGSDRDQMLSVRWWPCAVREDDQRAVPSVVMVGL